ncbi:hypothetical protein [Spirochaeta cellobiosiphila]|uniref:hypothetical protein n=1 Tax=Spirochaeta cellobiosiphila TaxID=504483 RepID=UPI00041C5FAC|nr:hypothetical protein [Spirochaeta cellobiosiphila]
MNNQLLKSNAHSFYLAGERCMQQIEVEGNIQFLAVPAAVNYAFSIELALKYLIGNATRGHDLEKLFNELEVNIGKDIIERMSFDRETFLSKLHAFSRTFEDWRYLHETKTDKSFDRKFLHELGGILLKYC